MSGRGARRADLGQHFLVGGWLASELVEQAGVGAGDLVVEIGAGTGVLTEALARRAGRVLAVERDPRLAERARSRLAGYGNVRVLTADALELPLPRRPFRVLANPPFRATAAILPRLLGDPGSALERADLVVQEQAARRYAARRPSNPETVEWGAWYELATGRRLGPDCFRPPPRVAAAVLVARRRRPPLVPIGASWPWSGPASGILACRCGAAWSRRSAAVSCAGWPVTWASPSTPAQPTWTRGNGPACRRSSLVPAGLGRAGQRP